jgi:cytochrome c1
VKRAAIFGMALIAVMALGATPAAKRASYDANLPILGTKFHSLPAGKGKQLAEASCFPCHSADMLVQQRLNEKQWTAEVDKMIRWGALVKDSDKPAMIVYLSKSFGPSNKFTPVKTRPVGY